MLLKFQERLGDMTTEIENTAEKLRKYYDPDLANMFAELEDADSILGGCGGVVLSLICLLKNKAHVFDILMLNS